MGKTLSSRGNNKTEERRKYKRFSRRLSARYLKENEEEWKECTVTNISRTGIGIIVYVHEKIPVGSFLRLEIIVPKREEPVKVRVTGVLKWIDEEKERMNFVGGIEFAKVLDEIEWTNLMYFIS